MDQTETDRQSGDSPSGAEPGARTSDLDSLLKDFETQKPAEDLKPVLDFVKTEMAAKQQKTLDDDLTAATESLKKHEGLGKVPDKLLRGLMEAHALDDPSFVKAFENRGQDPKGWETALSQGAEFATELLGKIPKDGNIRSDVEAAAAAVDGTSHEAPRESELPPVEEQMAMSDQAFDKLLQAEIRKSEGA